MKFTISLCDLRDAVTWAARGLPATPVLPVMTGMLLTASEDDTLTVSAFDLDTAATATATAHVSEPGTALLPGNLLRALTSALRGDTAEITTSDGDVALRCGTADLTLRTLPADEYPALPAPPEPAGIVDGADLAAAVTAVAPAASADPTMRVLCAVHLTSCAEGLRLEATDSYQAADMLVPWQPTLNADELDALIPARLLTSIARDIGDGPVTITATQSQPASLAGFTTPGRSLVTRCAAGEYPHLARHWPPATATATSVTVATAALADAIRAVTVLLDDGGKHLPVTIDAAGGELAIRAPGGERGGGLITIPVTTDGLPIGALFAPHRVLAAIAPAGEQCCITLPGEQRKPALITPAASAPACRYLVMPVA